MERMDKNGKKLLKDHCWIKTQVLFLSQLCLKTVALLWLPFLQALHTKGKNNCNINMLLHQCITETTLQNTALQKMSLFALFHFQFSEAYLITIFGKILESREALNLDTVYFIGSWIHLGNNNIVTVLKLLSKLIPDGSKFLAMTTPRGI